MRDLIIFGAGGFGREVHQVYEDIQEDKKSWNFIGFLDEGEALQSQEIHGYPVLGKLDWLQRHSEADVVIAIGSPRIKKNVIEKLKDINHQRFATLIHPRAWVGNRVDIQEGTIVCAGSMISTDIKIGKHVIINKNVTIGHDVVIDDYATIAPSVNLSGGAYIQKGCDLGTNSTVLPALSVGKWSIIGAGAVVTKEVPEQVTAVGVPAKVIKKNG
ncbi:acetyltransferase [Heliorestis acidaminivorans]|uniref:Acetyltransferase n=1 Tax=Heliorestis acidaminivorans TaxID=553427 RepID=A0A6I0EU92_9FIRM|nr:acetyltransferase [Heliorestis acidaminivorans]KAB2953754.1 acetyltransferase [Heliorestis acidaminivorans]